VVTKRIGREFRARDLWNFVWSTDGEKSGIESGIGEIRRLGNRDFGLANRLV
jgi:hypothetical protein